jgi:hypothetical protein
VATETSQQILGNSLYEAKGSKRVRVCLLEQRKWRVVVAGISCCIKELSSYGWMKYQE